MAATVTLKLDTRQLHAATRRLRDKAHVAIVRSLKRAAVSGRTVMVRAIREDAGVSTAAARGSMRIEAGRVEHDHAIQVICTGARIPLIDFNAHGLEPSRGRGTGVSYRIGRGGRKRIRDAFIATLKSGKRGVFKRLPPSHRMSEGAWSKNLPIVMLHGPSLEHVFAKNVAVGEEAARASLVKNLAHEFSYALKQAGLS